jgi:hypothetical protein
MPTGPAEPIGLGWEEPPITSGAETTLELADRLLLVQKFQIDEVRDLLNLGDRIGYAACPQNVRDPIELSSQGLVHFNPFSSPLKAIAFDWFYRRRG